MSAQVIPAALEAEVIAKSLSGWSLRRIVEWLASEKHITTSWTAVFSVLQRGGPTAAAAALEQEPVRQYKAIVPTLMEALDKVEQYLKEIIEDTTALPAYRRITTQLSAVRSWQRIIMFKLRVCGYGGVTPRSRAAQPEPTTAPKAAQTPAPAAAPASANPAPAQPVAATSNIATTVAAAVATPVAPTPSRNGPCPCGSTKKYKACHGKPGSPPLPDAV